VVPKETIVHSYKKNFFKISKFFVSTLVFMKNVEEFVDMLFENAYNNSDILEVSHKYY